MDTIPSELLLKIFSYLCTGIDTTTETGCTLSLVSRRFRSAAFLILFETISLKSVARMRCFLQMLEHSVHSTGVPVIRNLFLYDGGYDSDEGPDYESGGTPIDVCTAIVSFAAPTLLTLAGDLRTIGFTYADLPSSSTFPHLRDFGLGCRNMSSNKIKTAKAEFPHMPNLRRLHKFAVLKTEEDILDVNLFTNPTPSVAPRLTHIRISNFDLLSTLPRIISDALTPSRQKSSQPQLRLPKTLERLMVQGTLRGVYDCLGSPESDEQWRIVCELQTLAAEKYGGVLCVPEWGDYEVRECEVEWRNVVEGEGGGEGRGEGCWRDPPRETFSLVEYNAMGCPMLCD